jgi:diguanylate cyclase (GGDEF)-like protein
MSADDRIAELLRENDALRRAVRTLHEIASLVRESLALEPTSYALLTGVTAGVGLGLNRAMLFFVDENARELVGGAAVGPDGSGEADRIWRSIEADAPDLLTLYEAGLRQRESPSPLDRRVRKLRLSGEGGTPVALALRRGRCVCGEGTDDAAGLFDLPTSIAAPLRSRTRIEGVLYADNRFTGRRIDAVSETVLGLIADHAGRAIAHAKSYENLAVKARTDSLTGLGHHGAMMEAVREALGGDNQRTVGLAMIDLDDFKKVNDRLGHRAGDALLAGIAGRLNAQVRQGETPFRYGGEEFAILLPDIPREALGRIGERLRSSISERPFPIRSDLALEVTCSIGLATRLAGSSAGSLIEAADAALLRAKAAGKNRIELDR